ncbi:hypothetical protein ACFSWD_21780 [Paenibacillus xanthanilyticus]
MRLQKFLLAATIAVPGMIAMMMPEKSFIQLTIKDLFYFDPTGQLSFYSLMNRKKHLFAAAAAKRCLSMDEPSG